MTRAKAGVLVHVQVSLALRKHIIFGPLSKCQALKANSDSGVPRRESWLALVMSLAKKSGIACRSEMSSDCSLNMPCNHKR